MTLPLWAQDLAVQGTGYGLTENEALTKAKQDALANGIGQSLLSQTEVENFMVKKDLIITETLGNIKKYKVLESVKGEDGAYKVTIQAEVSKSAIRADLSRLKILNETLQNPRVAILVTDSYGGKQRKSSGFETELIRFFRSRSFEVVDPNQVLRFAESKEGQQALGGDPEALAKLGAHLNADVLITGSAESEETDLSGNSYFENTGMKSSASRISLKAFEVASRSILAVGNEEASMVHPNPQVAAEKASLKALKKTLEDEKGFFNQLVESWQKQANNGKLLQVAILGIENYGDLGKIRSQIEALGEKANQRSFSEGILEMDLTFTGSADDLAVQLESVQLPKGKFKVTKVLSGRVEAKWMKMKQID